MEKFFCVVCCYLFGSAFIHKLCVKLSEVPLIDYHAWGIRNFLCFLWLIICVIVGIFVPVDSK